MATQAQFIAAPTSYPVKISTANANRDGTGTLGTLVATNVGTTAIDIVSINMKAEGTTAAGMLRLFLVLGAATTFYLVREFPTGAATPSSTVPASALTIFFPGGLQIPVGYSLQIGTNNAEVWDIVATGGPF